MTTETLPHLTRRITDCKICAQRFAATRTAHRPRPVAWLSDTAPVLLCGQAPGARVHESGIPFDDRSGDRLRDWLGVTRDEFYDRSRFAVLPMAFCFPGYSANGSDLPPPKVCRETWHDQVIAAMPQVRLTVLIGGYAQKWALDRAGSVTDTVRNHADLSPHLLPLPHPSWRNTGWLKKNPWFETELVPKLREKVSSLLEAREVS